MLRPTFHAGAQARHQESTRLPLQTIHSSWSRPLIFLESTVCLSTPLLFLSQAPSALAWMMVSTAPTSHAILQSDLTRLYFTLSWLPLVLGQTQLLTMDDEALPGMGPANRPTSSILWLQLQVSTPAISPARSAPPSSPDLLPRSLPHSLQPLNQRSPQGNLP